MYPAPTSSYRDKIHASGSLSFARHFSPYRCPKFPEADSRLSHRSPCVLGKKTGMHVLYPVTIWLNSARSNSARCRYTSGTRGAYVLGIGTQQNELAECPLCFLVPSDASGGKPEICSQQNIQMMSTRLMSCSPSVRWGI